MLIALVAAIALVAGITAGITAGIIIYKPRLDVARARLADAEKQLTQQREDFDSTLSNLKMEFRGLSSEVLKETREEFLKQADPKIGEHIRPLADALKRYEEAIRTIENKREEAYGGLTSVIRVLQTGQSELTRETGSLVSALKSHSARGKWGEMTLRRVAEVSGMSKYCDFEEQASVTGAEGRLRPDMTVKISGGHTIVVDAKAPLDAYMNAMEAKDESSRARHLGEHAQAVRDHMRSLGQKSYWAQFKSAPDLVVLFLPGESFFSAALEGDRNLIEEGLENRVLIATPTTLIALLRSFALGWQRELLAENAELISEAGKDLFDRFVTFTEHFDKMGDSLSRAVKAFNGAVGSWESRVMPGARKLKELGAAKNPEMEIKSPDQVETAVREIVAPDIPPQ